jgi:hypothetical protein
MILKATDRLDKDYPRSRRAIQALIEYQRITLYGHPMCAIKSDHVEVLPSLGRTTDEIDRELDELSLPHRSDDPQH